jgi:hypothetical protein
MVFPDAEDKLGILHKYQFNNIAEFDHGQNLYN